MPILFVLCANPKPIGLAIKHRYGLDTETGEFEWRRILEKFVDTYIDMMEPLPLSSFVQWLWSSQNQNVKKAAALIQIDEDFVISDWNRDTVRNAKALQAMQSDNPLYSNLRLLQKSLKYVCHRNFYNKHLLWTAWHLEIAEQMNIQMRQHLAIIANDVQHITMNAIKPIFNKQMNWRGRQLIPVDNPDATLFGIYRGLFWDSARERMNERAQDPKPEAQEAMRILKKWLSDYRTMDFMIILSLLPTKVKVQAGASYFLKVAEDIIERNDQFGWLLANY